MIGGVVVACNAGWRAGFVTTPAFVRRDAHAPVGGVDERSTHAWRVDADLPYRVCFI